jgi:hypothetical protein
MNVLSSRNQLIWFLALVFLWSCNRGPDRALVISQVQSASQLASVEYVLNKIVLGDKVTKAFGFKLSESQFLAKTEARIKAGIDLNKISQEDVKVEGDRISLHLPPVEILNFSYPAENFEIDFNYFTNSRINSLTVEDVDNFYRLGELAIRRDMHFLGIEKTAQDRTRVMLGGILKAAGYKEVYLEFSPMDYSPAEAYDAAWQEIRNTITGEKPN